MNRTQTTNDTIMTTPAAPRNLVSRLGEAAVAFVAAPASPWPLATFRIGLAIVLLVQAGWIAGSLYDLHGPGGLIQWSVSDRWIPIGVPRLRWFAEALGPFGLEAATVVQLFFFVYVASLACLMIGWHTRIAAIAAWFTHLTLKMSASASVYGVDHFANISLFYAMWMPLAGAASVDRSAGRCSGEPSAAARLGLRVLQIHLCIVYFASGIEKASGEGWWTGAVIWDSVMRPDLTVFNLTWLARAEWVTVAVAWGTLIVEIGYPIYVWPRLTRRAWALATVGMHVGIAIFLGLWAFSGIMIVLNTAAFLVPSEPTHLEPDTTDTPNSAPGSRRQFEETPAPEGEKGTQNALELLVQHDGR